MIINYRHFGCFISIWFATKNYEDAASGEEMMSSQGGTPSTFVYIGNAYTQPPCAHADGQAHS